MLVVKEILATILPEVTWKTGNVSMNSVIKQSVGKTE